MLEKTKALRKKLSAPLTKAIRYIPEKHHKYKMAKGDAEVGFLKDYNAKSKTGVNPPTNRERATFNMIKDKYK